MNVGIRLIGRSMVGCLLGQAVFAAVAHAALVQVGDFRIGSAAVASTTSFETFSYATRGVTGATYHVDSTFTGTSQNLDGTITSVSAQRDISLLTSIDLTRVGTLSRYAASDAGIPRAGAIEWTFDFTSLATSLANTGQKLDAASIRLNDAVSDTVNAKYDVLLTYDAPASGVAYTPISSTSAGTNYTTFYKPTKSAGTVTNGSYLTLAANVTTNSDLTQDITALYNGGVRKFSLIVDAGAFYDSRNFDILSGSGIYIATSPTPEPTAIAVAGLGAIGLLRRRRNV